MFFYLFGNPIKNSISHQIHNFIFNEFNLNHKYLLFEKDNLDNITNIEFKGASITITLKEKILPIVDILDNASLKIGAVNTIFKKNSKTYGFNTDWIGIIKPLKLIHNKKWINSKVLILGAGGTARSAIYGIQSLNCNQIYIYNRTLKKAIKLADEFECNYIKTLDQI